MRKLVIEFEGEDWDDEDEAVDIEEKVQEALEKAGIEYTSVMVR